MKLLLTGLGMATAVVVVLFPLALPDTPEKPGTVTVVGARDGTPPVSARVPSRAAPMADISTTSEMRADEDPLPAQDASAITQLFSAQPRDASWADQAERRLISYLGVGGSADCALYLCRVRVRLPVSPSRRAEAIATELTRDWPPDISYNSLTAQIVGSGLDRELIFYVTRNDAI